MIDASGMDIRLEIDGGVGVANIKEVLPLLPHLTVIRCPMCAALAAAVQLEPPHCWSWLQSYDAFSLLPSPPQPPTPLSSPPPLLPSRSPRLARTCSWRAAPS